MSDVILCFCYLQLGLTGVEDWTYIQIGHVFEAAADVFFVLMLILLASGYTISQARLSIGTSFSVVTFLFTYVLVYTVIFIWEDMAYDEAEVVYRLESPPGYCLVTVRLLLWIWFTVLTTKSVTAHSNKRDFYAVFYLFYTAWFWSGPIIALVSVAHLPTWSRQKTYVALASLAAFSGHIFFLVLTLPANFNKNFPFHVKTNQINTDPETTIVTELMPRSKFDSPLQVMQVYSSTEGPDFSRLFRASSLYVVDKTHRHPAELFRASSLYAISENDSPREEQHTESDAEQTYQKQPDAFGSSSLYAIVKDDTSTGPPAGNLTRQTIHDNKIPPLYNTPPSSCGVVKSTCQWNPHPIEDVTQKTGSSLEGPRTRTTERVVKQNDDLFTLSSLNDQVSRNTDSIAKVDPELAETIEKTSKLFVASEFLTPTDQKEQNTEDKQTTEDEHSVGVEEDIENEEISEEENSKTTVQIDPSTEKLFTASSYIAQETGTPTDDVDPVDGVPLAADATARKSASGRSCVSKESQV